ncbi:MAG TPA: YggS family pyridoxal phosphate-dependent enzyme [Jatrophihabitans sp.]|uniref:YggS family pyridoxal phosphate-dependent enzyme n=1 Tax=Jatrophihabitans sp. TaxID=1932789 RepID=UPI002DFD5C53|nr:YggS family pyridoxal phosphate-dependent enzyme [Jatrophihabitans sp.]
MTEPVGDDRRQAELVTALGAVRARIADACVAVGRDPQEVTLVAVTKTCPATDIATLARLGVLDIGEARDQEARAKLAELAEAPYPQVSLRWHLIGRLQTNKARSVVGYAHAVHSVDRPKLARALADAAAEHRDHPLDVFVQVSLDGDPERGGVVPAELPALADLVAERPELRLRGLMAVPPVGSDADEQFTRLAELARGVRDDHPAADALSAGMSDDLEAAVRHGSTHVRVGSALLGRRPPIVS